MEIAQIWMTQRKLRNPNQVPGMIQAILGEDSLPPILLARTLDRLIRVENGHHRLAAYWLAGRRYLDANEFLLIESDRWRPLFGRIHELLARTFQ